MPSSPSPVPPSPATDPAAIHGALYALPDAPAVAAPGALQGLLALSADPTCVVLRDGTLRAVGDAAAAAFGWDPEAVIGTPLADAVHPDDRAALRAALDALLDEPAVVRTLVCRWRLARPTAGGWRIVASTLRNCLADPCVAGVLVQARDVTPFAAAREALRESEARLELTLAATTDGTWDWNVERDEMRVSPGVAALLGRPADACIMPRAAWIAGIHPEDRAAAPARLDAHLRGETPQYEAEYRVGGADAARWIQVRGKAVRPGLDGRATRVGGTITDVTRRVREAEARRETEARYRALVEQAREGIATVDCVGAFAYLNPCFARMLATPAEGLTGTLLFDLVDGPQADELQHAFWALQRQPQRPTPGGDERPDERPDAAREIRLRRADGRACWTLLTMSPRYEADGTFAGALVLATDITEAKRNETKFQTLVEQSLAGVYVIQDDRFVYVNPRCADIFGRTQAECLGLPSAIDVVAPGSRPLVRERGQRRHAGDREQHFRFAVLRPGGDTVEIEVYGTLAEFHGRPAILGTALDVTEQVRAQSALAANEERLRRIMDSSADLVCILDHAGAVRYASPAYEHRLGYAPNALLGQACVALLHPEDLDRVQAACAQVLHHAGAHELEVRVRHADGTYRTYAVTARNLADDPSIAGVLVTGHDVTHQRRLEAEFRQAQKMEAVGRLAGGVAHDFNNLLTAVSCSAEFLRDAIGPTHPARGDVDEILKATARAAALTRQLLTFSRKQVVQPRVVDLNATVAGLERMLARLLGEDVAIETLLTAGLPAIEADPGQLEQVLVNLAVNARDAMPGGGTLTIETAPVTLGTGAAAARGVAAGAYVQLTVRDTGVGMDAATRERVFEPFFTTKGAGAGTGLGLATVFGILQQAGGAVAVDSAPGRGAAFTLLFPASAHPAADHDGAAPDLAAPAGRGTVLLVEDESAVRQLARRILQRQGYAVLEARHGRDGVRRAEEAVAAGAPIDLVVSDVVMPELDGPGLVAELRARGMEPPVLFLSGYTPDEFTRRGALAPDAAFLPKPFTAADLLRAVQQAIHQPSHAPLLTSLR